MVPGVVQKNIKRYIELNGMKQSAVAAKAKISEKQFSALVCGRKLMRPEHIANIAVALGVTPNDLFSIHNEPDLVQKPA